MRRPRFHNFALFIGLFALPACVDYGVERDTEYQSWTQPSRDSGVDILWVVDDSMSMYEEQEQLALHADSFIGFLSTISVDYRLGVVRTDMDVDQPGALVGEVLTPDTAALAEAFAAQISNDADGSRDERGFDVTLEALDPEGANAGSLNPEADLEIVFFSDEDDHSTTDLSGFLDGLDAQRPDAAIVANAIVGDLPEGCASMKAAADPGERYVSAQEATGGLRESICAADYAALLERMALAVIGLDDTFVLPKVPELETMEVRVDGALVHRRDRHGWRYEGGENAIVFDGYAVPPPGAEIEVSYHEWYGGPRDLDTGAE